MMKLYQRCILPKLVNASCGMDSVAQERAKVVPSASGRVLDVGFGSGHNVPFYRRDKVQHVWALEPSKEMWELAQKNVGNCAIPIEFVNTSAEDLPLDDASVDTAVITFTLCTIPDVPRALEQISRVLKKDGRLLFVEHGAAPEQNILRWQQRLEPVWTHLAGGCHLTRRAPDLLEKNDFQIIDLTTGYIPGWKIDSFIYSGTAIPNRTSLS
jgi:ubiquinone/menaquinone biosynthesis C-methylase UbiE